MSRRVSVWTWLRAVRDSTLSPAAKLTAFVLATYMRNGTCWPARRRIAAGIGKSERTVTRALGELERAGVIKVEHRMNSSSIYEMAQAPDTWGIDAAWPDADEYPDMPF